MSAEQPTDRVSGLVDRIRAGDRVALARGISLIEAGDPDGLQISERLFASRGRAHVVGITGPPGAGKSTLTDALVREYRSRDLSVGVIAVDPVSPRTGGATLGDRIRMQRAAADPKVFIRSSAARGYHGGLGLTTMQTARLMDVAGYERVIIETVGAGQDGVTVASVAATVVLVQTPASGDEVQALKAGVLEVADIFVVNKANLPGASAALADLHDVAEAAGNRETWTPAVLATTAQTGEGVAALADAIEAHRVALATSTDGEVRAARRLWAEVQALVHNEVRSAVDRYLTHPGTAQVAMKALVEGRSDPITMARSLLAARGWGSIKPG